VQVVHFIGKQQDPQAIQERYTTAGIKACVKGFEEHMYLAWKCADLVICRSGAATIAELIAYEVPAILIPFPYATDNHQKLNGLFAQNRIQGARVLDQKELTPDHLQSLIYQMKEERDERRLAIQKFKRMEHKKDLCSLICEFIPIPRNKTIN